MLRSCILIIAVSLIGSSSRQLVAKTIHVDVAATGANTGQTWHDAYRNLQDALQRAVQGDEIWIASGVYHPTSDSDRNRSFVLKAGVALRGGFTGNESSPDQRDPLSATTVLSGNIGDAEDRLDNSCRVIVSISLTPGPLLDRLVLREAYNDRDSPESRGGGIYNFDTDLTLIECTLEDNYANGGAGLWNEEAQVTADSCVFRRNANNGVTNWLRGNVAFTACSFVDNETIGAGAAFNAWVYLHQSSFIDCIFTGNKSGTAGGAYFGPGDPVFENCLFVKNRVGNSGAIAYLDAGRPTFSNCVGFDNWSNFNGGGIGTHSADTILTVKNCILWGNRSQRDPDIEGNQVFLHAGTIDHSCIEGWTGRFGGEGNFGDDPEFIDSERENLRLCDTSPCVDAGDDSVVTHPTDLDGNPRILGARVDIGCYESLCPAIVALNLKCTSSSKLKASATTTLPEGATVRFTQPDAQGKPKPHPAAVKRTGKATAKWRPDSDAPVCIEGCASGPCAQEACG